MNNKDRSAARSYILFDTVVVMAPMTFLASTMFGARIVRNADTPAVADIAREPISSRYQAQLGIEIVIDGLLDKLT